MIKLFYLIFFVLVGSVGFFFFLRNDLSVRVDYFLGAMDVSLPLLLIVVLALGVLLGWITCVPMLLKLRRRNAGLQKRNDLATREIANLRALPLRDAS